MAVGLGYILVEIAFIQRFVLFLGHPTYALTVVIFLLMLSSGAGSLFSRLWLPRTRLGLGAAGARDRDASCADVFFLPGAVWRRWSEWASDTVCWSAAFSLSRWDSSWECHSLRACARSPPCPLRISRAGKALHDNAVEWAWAMNAAASVLGSVLAMVIAIQFGLTVTLACGAAAYLLALLLMPALRTKLA